MSITDTGKSIGPYGYFLGAGGQPPPGYKVDPDYWWSTRITSSTTGALLLQRCMHVTFISSIIILMDTPCRALRLFDEVKRNITDDQIGVGFLHVGLEKHVVIVPECVDAKAIDLP